MKLPVVILPEAQQDLVDARDWHDRQREGFGDHFSAAVESVFELLSATPKLFGVIAGDVRVCKLRRFPYIVHYRVLDNRVEVFAVLHARRDPSAWRSRV